MHTATLTASVPVQTKKLLIGNLPDSTRSAAIESLFTPVGKVLSVSLLAHGFAFVEMSSEDADRALVQLVVEPEPLNTSGCGDCFGFCHFPLTKGRTISASVTLQCTQ